jgi:hypothetical protein
LRGQSTTYLQRVAHLAITDAHDLERAGIGLRIDTDDRNIDEAADLILAQWDGLST